MWNVTPCLSRLAWEFLMILVYIGAFICIPYNVAFCAHRDKGLESMSVTIVSKFNVLFNVHSTTSMLWCLLFVRRGCLPNWHFHEHFHRLLRRNNGRDCAIETQHRSALCEMLFLDRSLELRSSSSAEQFYDGKTGVSCEYMKPILKRLEESNKPSNPLKLDRKHKLLVLVLAGIKELKQFHSTMSQRKFNFPFFLIVDPRRSFIAWYWESFRSTGIIETHRAEIIFQISLKLPRIIELE